MKTEFEKSTERNATIITAAGFMLYAVPVLGVAAMYVLTFIL